MPLSALGLVISAAVLHAGWNLVVKSSEDRLVATWMQLTSGALVFLPVLVVGGFPTDRLWPFAVSAVVHVVYALTLVTAYDRGDLSVVYPVARGIAPAIVAVGAAITLGDVISPVGVVAVGLIVLGILAGAAGHARAGVSWALVTGALIAVYTLVDGAAVRAGEESIRYTVAVFAGTAALLMPVVLILRRPAELLPAIRRDGMRNLVAGVGAGTAYMLVLAAARIAPLGLVSAGRETSVVFGALAGWLVLGERMGPRRVAASVVIAVGLVLAGL